MRAALHIEGLVKRFSGLTATDDLCLDVEEFTIHALIGPNGAGKTTLINQIGGELRSDAGRIELFGRDVTQFAAARRARLGLVRTYQITNLLDDSTVRWNLAMAVQARLGGNFRFLDSLSGRKNVWREADEILGETPLARRSDVPAGDLSNGERKQLELLMGLAGRPRLLLLDEPMAGLGHGESLEMIEALRKLRGEVTILLVEHDMDAVFALADTISVLVYGRIVESGDADAIRASDEVRRAYLGEEDAVC